jgi:hypothetical protein
VNRRIKTEWLAHCHFVHGLTFEEISALTGMSRAGIFKRLKLKKTGPTIGQGDPLQTAPAAGTKAKELTQANPGPAASPAMVTRPARILAHPSHLYVPGPPGPDDRERIRRERLLSFREEKKRDLT